MKTKYIYPSQLMRVKPKTRFKYFRMIIRGDLKLKNAPNTELKNIAKEGSDYNN